MPTIVGIDTFRQDTFTTGNPYLSVGGSPARDLSIVRGGDPSALLISAAAGTEWLEYPTLSGSPTRSWHAFAWRLDTNPAADVNVAYLWTTAGSPGRLAYAPGGGALYHFVGASGSQTIAYTLGTWVWVEQILNVSADPRVLNTRINGTDLTDVSVAEAASTCTKTEIGEESSFTASMRYSLYLWGTATSDSDWLGENAALSFLPGAGITISHSDAGTVSKSATLPWQLFGAASPNTLGQIPTTASVSRVWTSTTDPSVLNDSSGGYSIGDLWLNTNMQTMYWCTSSAVGAAIWKQVSV